MGETEMSARIAGQRELLTDGGTPPVIDAAFARRLALGPNTGCRPGLLTHMSRSS